MLSKASLAWRVGFALASLALALFIYANTFGEWWLWAAGMIGAGAALCWGRFWSFIMFMRDALMAVFGPAHTEEYERTVDGVRAAALNVHNWFSRHIAAGLSMAFMLAIYLTHDVVILLLGLIAVPVATSWPWVMKRFRTWRDSLFEEVAE